METSTFSSLRFTILFAIFFTAMLSGEEVTATEGIEASFPPPPPHDLQEHSFFSHTALLPPILFHLHFHELTTVAPSLQPPLPLLRSVLPPLSLPLMNVVVLQMFGIGGRREEDNMSMFHHFNPFLFLILGLLPFWVVFFCHFFFNEGRNWWIGVSILDFFS